MLIERRLRVVMFLEWQPCHSYALTLLFYLNYQTIEMWYIVYSSILFFSFCQKTNLHLYKRFRLLSYLFTFFRWFSIKITCHNFSQLTLTVHAVNLQIQKRIKEKERKISKPNLESVIFSKGFKIQIFKKKLILNFKFYLKDEKRQKWLFTSKFGNGMNKVKCC